MSASIGGQSVDIIRKLAVDLKLRTEKFEVSGLDGYGAQTLGLGDSEFQLIVVKYCSSYSDLASNNTAANTLIAALNAMEGTIISLVDNWGDTYNHVLVGAVESNEAKSPMIHLGNNGVRVQVTFACVIANKS